MKNLMKFISTSSATHNATAQSSQSLSPFKFKHMKCRGVIMLAQTAYDRKDIKKMEEETFPILLL